MRTIASLLVIVGTIAAAPAFANPELAQKKACTACHAVDKKVIGPAYNDVSLKYKGDAGAAAKLMTKVKQGGAGVWGSIPMPPQPIPDAELKVVVPYILGLKK